MRLLILFGCIFLVIQSAFATTRRSKPSLESLLLKYIDTEAEETTSNLRTEEQLRGYFINEAFEANNCFLEPYAFGATRANDCLGQSDFNGQSSKFLVRSIAGNRIRGSYLSFRDKNCQHLKKKFFFNIPINECNEYQNIFMFSPKLPPPPPGIHGPEIFRYNSASDCLNHQWNKAVSAELYTDDSCWSFGDKDGDYRFSCTENEMTVTHGCGDTPKKVTKINQNNRCGKKDEFGNSTVSPVDFRCVKYQKFSLSDDFLSNAQSQSPQNPNGPWTYVDSQWNSDYTAPDNSPSNPAWVNTQGGFIYRNNDWSSGHCGIDPQQVSFETNWGPYSVVWTAPHSNKYTVYIDIGGSTAPDNSGCAGNANAGLGQIFVENVLVGTRTYHNQMDLTAGQEIRVTVGSHMNAGDTQVVWTIYYLPSN